METRISNECVIQIHDACSGSTGMFEIGGILMGIKTDNRITVLEAIDIPSLSDSNYSYTLDGAKATQIANSSKYDFVGIWHSHTNSCGHFSETDKKVNQEFAEIMGGIISILVVLDGKASVKVSAFLINEDGESKMCL